MKNINVKENRPYINEAIRDLIIIKMIILKEDYYNPDLYDEELLQGLEMFIRDELENCILGQEQLEKLYQVIEYYRFEKQYDDLETKEACFKKCNDMITNLNGIVPNINGNKWYTTKWLFDHAITSKEQLLALFDYVDWKEKFDQFSYLLEQDLFLFSYLAKDNWSGVDMNQVVIMDHLECSLYYLVLVYGDYLSREQLLRMLDVLINRLKLVKQTENIGEGTFVEYTLSDLFCQQNSINFRLSYEECKKFMAGIYFKLWSILGNRLDKELEKRAATSNQVDQINSGGRRKKR